MVRHARSLAETIRARRRELGWTQEELADRVAAAGEVRFRQSDVSRLERGRVALPRGDRLERIAAVLGLSVGELLARSGWAGAAAAFGESDPERAHVVVVPVAAASGGTGTSLPRQRQMVATADLLRRRIAEASQTRDRTVDLLRRSAETLAGATRTRGRTVSEDRVEVTGVRGGDAAPA